MEAFFIGDEGRGLAAGLLGFTIAVFVAAAALFVTVGRRGRGGEGRGGE